MLQILFLKIKFECLPSFHLMLIVEKWVIKYIMGIGWVLFLRRVLQRQNVTNGQAGIFKRYRCFLQTQSFQRNSPFELSNVKIYQTTTRKYISFP